LGGDKQDENIPNRRRFDSFEEASLLPPQSSSKKKSSLNVVSKFGKENLLKPVC
jgi:hypothetical protein